jgi:ABC-type multidrug transport system, ATPase and permease components
MSSLRYLRPFLARYRRALVVGMICAVLSAVVSIFGPYILRLAVDDIQGRGIDVQRLLIYVVMLLVVALIDGVFKFIMRQCIIGSSFRIEQDLRTTLFDRYISLDQGFYNSNYTGDLMARATNDLSAVRQFLGHGLMNVASAIFLLVAAAIFMFTINAKLALMVMLLLPCTAITFWVIGGRMRLAFKQVQDQFGRISTRAQENFSGIRTIKAYAQEDAEIRVFREENERYRSYNLRYVLLSGMLWPLISVIMGTISALIFLVGGRFVVDGGMTIGELVQFNTYLGLLGWPMISLGWTVSLYQQAAASMGRLAEIFYRVPAVTSPSQARSDRPIQGGISFENVGIRFDYALAKRSDAAEVEIKHQQRDGWILRDVSFTVPHGSSLAIVGATGVGKSTLVSLLGRVRDPDQGRVLIDGVDVRELPLDTLRRSIAYVPQETFLFSVPLRQNVMFGIDHEQLPEQELQERVDRAVAISRLSNDLNQFPDGLDTMLGERGVTLSGGQKQRTAIARAVMRDPAILVLDDALSSVDTHTAAEILSGLREVMRNRTSIIIAQRIATVKDADQIIVLHEGKIAERGTHRELVQQGGLYAAMYRRELLEAELDTEN